MKKLLKIVYILGFIKLLSSFFFDKYVPLCLKTGTLSAILLALIIVLEIINHVRK